MEAANTTLNCFGLHFYSVSQSPEDTKQTYRSILSSSRAPLSAKERLSAQQGKKNPTQNNNTISWAWQICRASLRAFLRSATYQFP